MRDVAPLRLLGLVLVTLLAIAFATGTAVRAAPTASEVRLEAFQLLGGLPDDLCNDSAPDHAHTASCALCHLVAGAALPDPGAFPAGVTLARAFSVTLPQIRRAPTGPRNPATPTRGPPRG